jgi:hypothetical protein
LTLSFNGSCASFCVEFVREFLSIHFEFLQDGDVLISPARQGKPGFPLMV